MPAAAIMSVAKRNGAPAKYTSRPLPMATANVCVNKAGPKRLAIPVTLALAPCNWPCSEAPTSRLKSHGRRALQSPKREQRNAHAKFDTGSRQSEYQKPGDSEGETEHKRRAFADCLGDRADDRALQHD
jgi:hypothetical protein